MKEILLKKFTSRKYLATLVAQLAGVLTILVGGEHPVTVIAGAVLVIAAEVVYCIIEGRADLAAIKNAVRAASDAADQLGYDKAAEVIDRVGDVAEGLLEPAEGDHAVTETDKPASMAASDAEHIA